ncbi:hypothetical protein BJV82DRAFT_667235 [Fennellomyces sp. T-0311]|nr:hypothetical protein BJV82DRAFT_667235 [Fennellomyces sp. T-0311]
MQRRNASRNDCVPGYFLFLLTMETDPIDQFIEKYILEKAVEKEQVSFTQFLQTNVAFVVDHTDEGQLDTVERVWGSRFGSVAKKLNVPVAPRQRDAPRFQEAVNALAKQLITSAKPLQEYAEVSTTESAISNSVASKDNSHILTAEAKIEFEENYSKMEKTLKWEIRNGVYLEDLMYQIGKVATHEHPVHSFILDVGDPVWKKELKDMLHEVQTFGDWSMPALKKPLQDFFDAYNNQPEDNVLNFLIKKTDEQGPFDPYTNPDLYKLKNIVQQFLGYYVDDVFRNVHLWTEEDFVSHIWAPLDRFFQSSKILTTRNQTCIATSLRLYGERSISGSASVSGKKASIRPDLLLVHDNIEYGCAEVGKNLLLVPDKKEIVESKLHSPKIMKDVLNAEIARARSDVSTARKLKVICFNQTGLTMSVSVMDTPAGYVSRILETDKYTVPVQPEYIVSELFPILKLVLKAKDIVDRSITATQHSRLAADEPGIRLESTAQKFVLPPSLSTSILAATRKRNQLNPSEQSQSKRRSTKSSPSSSSSS